MVIQSNKKSDTATKTLKKKNMLGIWWHDEKRYAFKDVCTLNGTSLT